jgi:hypothetical protein
MAAARVLVVMACAFAGLGQSTVPRIPIPVVQRSAVEKASVFTRPALIVVVRIEERCVVGLTGIDGQLDPPDVAQQATAVLHGVLRVNQRLAFEPDLADRHLTLRLTRSGVDVAVNKNYVLLVDFAPSAPGLPWTSPDMAPPYVLATMDGGFEIDKRDRLHVLRRGGPLAGYDGKTFGELQKAVGYDDSAMKDLSDRQMSVATLSDRALIPARVERDW